MSNLLKVGVVGSRRRAMPSDRVIVFDALFNTLMELPVGVSLLIVSGGCSEGADFFAEEFAKEFGVSILVHHPAKWKLPDRPKHWDFTTINYERNQLIADDVDYLIALPADDRTGGAEDTIKRAKKQNKEVILL